MMRRCVKRLLLCLALALSVLGVSACEDKGQTTALPPLVTEGIPEGESVTSTVVTGGFTIQIYQTYAEIVGYEGIETVLTLPSTAAGVPVKLIGEKAFSGNTKITKVVLPAGLLTVDRFAFDGCKGLTEVVFGEKLEVIGDYAFRDSALTVLTLPETLVTIGRYSFYRTAITSLVIPDGVSSLGKYAFYGCERLTSLTIGARLREIEENAFYYCTALTEIVIPETVTKLGNYSFSSCTSLARVFVPSETASVGTGVFADCPSLVIYTPDGSAAMKAAARNGYACVACDSAEAMPKEGT